MEEESVVVKVYGLEGHSSHFEYTLQKTVIKEGGSFSFEGKLYKILSVINLPNKEIAINVKLIRW